MTGHEKYMQRCLELAAKGRKDVAPNPMVGSVLVHKDRIIGEGYHQRYGGPHAEVNAINSVREQELISRSTLYVNLEPCAHHGKTPPCSDLIIQKKIPRVVIGCKDIYAEVAGKGIARMRKAGIEVITGVLEQESRELNKRFFTFHSRKRPYVILKWAETIDGYIDVNRNDAGRGIAWITHPYLRIPVHKWRAEEAAILVGTQTALNDNPKLNTREWAGPNPVRFVLDRNLRLPADLALFDRSIPTYVFTEKKKDDEPPLYYRQIAFDNRLLPELLYQAYSLNINSLIVEGGRRLLQSFIDQNLWDEARVLIGNKTFGRGVKGPLIQRKMDTFCQFGSDRILYFTNQ